MADLSFASYFQRYKLNEYYRGFELPQTREYGRVRRCRDTLLEHPVTASTGLADEDYIKL